MKKKKDQLASCLAKDLPSVCWNDSGGPFLESPENFSGPKSHS